ncbi:MAG TPA: OmpA family protein [Polyangia bacterium]|nr:OmpA family protein [Polyangia bacterium]
MTKTNVRFLFVTGALVGALSFASSRPALAGIDLGGLANKAEGAASGKATEEVLKKANAKLMDVVRKNQCSFKSDSDELEAGCEKKALNIVKTLGDVKKQLTAAGIKKFKFEVSGHTDTSGKPEHNKELSGKRAAAIVKELTARGVAADEIVSVGMGSEKPLVSPDNTEAKKKKNRRYEIQVRI